MIGYSCKYAPLELIAAYGGKALMLDAETKDFSRAETLTHANVCCHAKALLTQALDISELVLTDLSLIHIFLPVNVSSVRASSRS